MSNKNINECEGGVPGGITPDLVGGMGSIELPGDNPNNGYDGIKGSGDIPKGSGHVYKQIMTYDTFIKLPEWKKKKKNKNKKEMTPDSPYYKHSPNPPEYSHVYDFKEYIKKVKDEP